MGGGGSCFAKGFCDSFPEIKRYDIIDNNEYAVSLFQEMELPVDHKGQKIDLTKKLVVTDRQYDFVYSIGLIEHFLEEERKRVIQAHMDFCKPGGIVLISFPTPTFKYRFFRKAMELLHVWQFWDEHPLTEEMVRPDIECQSEVLESKINKKLPLTQRIVIARKKPEGRV